MLDGTRPTSDPVERAQLTERGRNQCALFARMFAVVSRYYTGMKEAETTDEACRQAQRQKFAYSQEVLHGGVANWAACRLPQDTQEEGCSDSEEEGGSYMHVTNECRTDTARCTAARRNAACGEPLIIPEHG